MNFTASFPTAVVILSYNSQQWHELFLPLIVSEGIGKYDVFVVDHASTQAISSDFKAKFPSVYWMRLEENHGFAWGYHEALKQIQATYYILLSADFEVTPGWFSPLQNKMELHPEIAALQPKIRYYKEREKFEYAGGAGGFMDAWGYLFCRGRVFDTLEVDEGQYENDIEIFWASGGCLMVRASVYHQLGGLDADFFAHMEEVDLCWRIKNAGHKIAFVHNSIVFHVGGSVISYGSPQKTFYNFRNSYFLFMKNEESKKLLWLIPLRLVLDGLAGLQFIAKGQFRNVVAIIKAHFSFYFNIFSLLNKRKACKKLWKKKNSIGIVDNYLILDYYLYKRKTFNDLEIGTSSI